MSRKYPVQECARLTRRSVLHTLALAALSATGLPAWASGPNYPHRAITVVVPSPPGGIVDASARFVTDPLARIFGQPVVIDNKGGGSGNIAYAQVARAAADGYTLLASYSGFHVGNPSLASKLQWAQKDLEPVALVTASTNIIAVNASVPVRTLEEFIAYLKANPGKLSYASQGNGSVAHIGTEIFKQHTGTDLLHVPYRGSGPALQDLLANQVQVLITTPPSIIGHVRTGKLRALAVTGKRRHPGLPDVPTTDEAGLKGYELETWVGLFAPAGTPRSVVDHLSEQARRVLETPQARAAAEAAGFEARYEPPQVLAQRVQNETAHWAKVIAQAGIKPE